MECSNAVKDVKDEFPKSIKDFGYEFNKDGQLRKIGRDEVFQFNVKDGDQGYNQAHYEALGECITEYVYGLLETECGLKRHYFPLNAEESQQSFIFISDDFNTNSKLLILIHGAGVVRAGQWSRRLIINDSVNSGTQIPFIKRGLEEGFAILVLNTNYKPAKVECSHSCSLEVQRILRVFRFSKLAVFTPEGHAEYVWKHYVQKGSFKKIALVAHSYGGVITVSLFKKFKKDFKERVFAVALTDSVHYINSRKDFEDLIKVTVNWVSSNRPLDEILPRLQGDVRLLSAGVSVHELTSWSSFGSIFNFIHKQSALFDEQHAYEDS